MKEQFPLLRNSLAWLAIPFLICSAYIYLYVENTTLPYVLFQDDVTVTHTLAKPLLEGRWTIADAWRPHNGLYRSLLGSYLTAINIEWFGWDRQIELKLGAIWAALIGVGFCFIASNIAGAPRLNWKSSLLILSALPVVVSLTAWENYVFSGGTYHVLQAAGYVLSLCTLVNALGSEKLRSWMAFYVTQFWCLLIATGIYSVAFGIACTMALLALAYCTPGRRRRFMLGGVFLNLTCLFVYCYGLDAAIQESTGGTNSGLQLALRLRIFFNLFAADLLHNEAGIADLSAASQLVLGIPICLIFFAALVLCIVQIRKHSALAVPFIMILHAFGVAAMISLGRTSFGPNAGLSSRYVTQTNVGLLGVLIVCCWLLLGRKSGPITKMIAVGVLAGASICSGYSARAEWKLSPNRQRTYELMKARSLIGEFLSMDELKIFQAGDSPDHIKSAILIWREYSLGPFHEYRGRRQDFLVNYLSGTHAPEGEGWRWVSQEAVLLIRAGRHQSVSVTVYRPAGDYASELALAVDGAPPVTRKLPEGVSSFTLDLRPGQITRVHLTANHSIGPDQADMRNRAYVLSSIVPYTK